MLEVLIILMVLAVIPAAIAGRKGRPAGVWWLYGVILFPVALIHSVLVGVDQRGLDERAAGSGQVRCPHCSEFVRPEAVRCRHCGQDVNQVPENSAVLSIPEQIEERKRFERRRGYATTVLILLAFAAYMLWVAGDDKAKPPATPPAKPAALSQPRPSATPAVSPAIPGPAASPCAPYRRSLGRPALVD